MGAVKDLIKKWLDIGPAENQHITIDADMTHQDSCFECRLWYRGSASELEQFYKSLTTAFDDSIRARFWAAVPSKGNKLRKIHSGLTLTELRLGCKGPEVRTLQILLYANGYNCGTADGVFGFRTNAAIRNFLKTRIRSSVHRADENSRNTRTGVIVAMLICAECSLLGKNSSVRTNPKRIMMSMKAFGTLIIKKEAQSI